MFMYRWGHRHIVNGNIMLVCLQLIVKICDTSACLVEVWVLLSDVLFLLSFLNEKRKVQKSARCYIYITTAKYGIQPCTIFH